MSAPERHVAWHSDAREMQRRGLTISEIAELLGRSYSGVYKAIHPERQATYNQRAMNQRRANPAKKRASDRAYEEAHRNQCADCGAPVFRKSTRCRTCLYHHWEAVRVEIVRLRREGRLTNAEIAERVDVSAQSVASIVCRLRRDGVDIPPSPHYVTGRAFGREAAAA